MLGFLRGWCYLLPRTVPPLLYSVPPPDPPFDFPESPFPATKLFWTRLALKIRKCVSPFVVTAPPLPFTTRG